MELKFNSREDKRKSFLLKGSNQGLYALFRSLNSVMLERYD